LYAIRKKEKTIVNKKSSRHHYIPEFIIKGFTDAKGKVFIYDKIQDEIKNITKSPKGIFFEWDRNTFDFGEMKSTIIEDNTYGKIDNLGGEAITVLRTIDLSKSDISMASIYKLQVFILNLFWRIPSTDKLFDIIYEIINSNTSVDLKNKEWLKKHQKTYMFIHTLNKSIENLRNTKHEFKIVEFSKPSFILTDNPTLYQNPLISFEDLDKSQYIFPISDKRGFIQFLQSSNKNGENKFEGKHSYWYNALAIEQSERYSASGELSILNNSIKIYKHIKETKQEIETKELLFNRIKI
jgi:hypothetical protein